MRPPHKIRLQRSAIPATGLEPLNGAAPVHSSSIIRAFSDKPGKVFLLYGERAVFPLSLQVAANAMAGGNSIAVVDGCNQFDVHALTRFARSRKIDPNKFLKQIYISRGFTCYQMEQAVAHKLPAFLSSINSRTAIIFGLLDTFYDEQASTREVQQILQRLLKVFSSMRSSGISLLLVCTEKKVEPRERNQLFDIVKKDADRVYKFITDEHNKMQLLLESQRPASKEMKGVANYGTHCTDLHQSDRCRTGKLVKIPARPAQK
jgi:hypothetical protein